VTLVQPIYSILRGPAVPMQFVHTDVLSMTLVRTFELRPEISTRLIVNTSPSLRLPPTSPSPQFVESDSSSCEARVPRVRGSGRAALGCHISSLTVLQMTTSRSYDIAPPLDDGCGHVKRSATFSDARSLCY
jgi:hypothetical protein